MSTTIDQKVVEMRFDNKQFESNAQTSLSTIDKLKRSLNFTGASKGLEEVNEASKKVNMSGLGSAVEAVRDKFSALEVMGVTALVNITNSAINAGKKIVSALTIDPITTGFQEYETQINAVQTILANTQSKGTTLTDVNAALDELNKYADQTIYNFTEMTRNIGTFTAAGVDLDKSVTSIKGIANLAAVSGSTSQQASTAMYQLSQALAAGKVSLMDWNSVVNAGMGGELFQNALKRTATQMGTNVDAMIEKYGSFRESLTEGGWLTAEVLTETLTQLSGAYTEADLIAQGYSEKQAKEITELAQTAVDAATKVKTFTQLWDTLKEAAQSGWTQTWEILVGDFEESKELLTELSETFGEIINQSAESRNTLLYDTMTSNWKKITDGITEAGLSAEDFQEKVTSIAKEQGIDVDSMIAEYGSLEKAFKNGALSSDLLDQALTKMTGTSEEITKKMADLRGEYKSNDDILKALTKAGYEQSDVQNLLTKASEGQEIALNDLTDAQLTSIGYTAEQIQSIRKLATYSELANGSLSEFIDNVSVQNGREMLIDTLRVSLRSLISVCEAVGKAWREVFPPTTSDQLLGVITSVREFALALKPSEETLDKIQRTFRGLFSVLDIARQAFGALLSPIGVLFGDFGSLSGGILDAAASFGDWLYALNQSIKAGDSFSVISDGISAILKKISDGVHTVIDGVGGLSGVFSSIGNGISTVFKGVFDILGKVVNWIRENITAGDIFAGLAGGGLFVLFKKFSGLIDKVKGIFEGFGDGDALGGFSDILGSVHDSLETFQQGIKVASLVGIAVAVTLLTSSLRKISELDLGEVTFSLIAIRLMILSLTSGFKSLTKTLTKFDSKGVVKSSVALIGIAVAINILASAMKKISELSWGDIAKGLTTTATLLIALSASIKIMGNSGVTLRTSIAIIALAQACKMLAEALQEFGDMTWEEIAHGLAAMGGALVELTAVIAVMSKVGGGKSLLGATSLLIAVQSLDEISENLERLGNLSWEVIGRGLAAMGGALAEFTAALAILSAVGGFGSLLGGTAILIAVQSLDEISENLKKFGSMSWEEIGRGLSAMGGALAEFTAALAILSAVGGFGSLLGGTAILVAVQSLDEISENLERLGNLSWEVIGRGLTAMGGALTELGLVVGLLGKLTGLSGLIGAGTILLGIQGLGDLADYLQKFGSMSWEEIGRGLVAMGGALAEIAVISGLTGTLAGFAGLVGAGTILLAVQGLDQLANALEKFGSMSWEEIERGLNAMGGAMAETALGGLANTFSGLGAASIAEIAGPLGTLADSIKKWAGVTVPEGLGEDLGSLATGVQSFTLSGWGADAIATMAAPLGDMADSIKKWSDVSIPDTLGSQLTSLASGVEAFNFSGWGADALTVAAPGIGAMSNAIRKWSNVTIPEGLSDGLIGLAKGVEAFSFAFVGGWSISSLVEPLTSLAEVVKKWNGVKIPEGIDADLQSLADGIGAFNFSFVGGWSIGSVVEPLANLADSVRKWNGVTLSGVGDGLTDLANGLTSLGDVGVKSIVSEFDGAADKVTQAVTNMLNGITSSISGKDAEISASFETVMTNAVAKVTGQQPQFINAAGTLMTQFSNSIKTKTVLVVGAFTLMTAQAVTTIRGRYSEFYSAGSYIVDGFASGIRANAYKAISEAQSMASKAQSQVEKTLGINSPSKAFYGIGNYTVQGFANGIRDQFGVAEKVSIQLGTVMLNSIKERLGIHSPSVVMRDEVGCYVVEGIAEGITEDMSAEEAAAQKAQNIVDAFQSEFDRIDLTESISDLEKQLSDKINGITVEDSDSESLARQIDAQMERVGLANAKYQAMLQTFGESDANTTSAYKELLESQISLADLVEELNTSRQSQIQSNQSALKAYNQYLIDNQANLLAVGFTLDEIKAAAAADSGYDPNAPTKFETLDIKDIMAQAMKGVEIAYDEVATDTATQLVAQSTDIGTSVTTALGTGIQNGTSQAVQTTTEMVTKCSEAMNRQRPSWIEAGAYLVEGFVEGIQSNIEKAAQEAAAMAMAAYNAAMKALDAHSPSKRFMEVGSYAALGFANGISSDENLVRDSANSIANTAINSTKDAISKLVDVINGDIDTQPTIRPVLDLSDVQAGTSRLNTLFSQSRAMTISTNMGRTVTEDTAGSRTDTNSTPVNQFIQNNYSPKALSRIEIYRQTKNLVSASERMGRKK